jgi:hypothetical protein
VNIGKVKTGGWLVEHVNGAARRALRQFLG